MMSTVPSKFGRLLIGATLLGAILTSLLLRPGLEGLLGSFLAACMVAVALVDVRRYIIPNELTVFSFALVLLRSGTTDVEGHQVASAALRAAITIVLFYLLSISYRYFRGRDGFGLGDVKLAGVAAAWLDWPMLLVAIEGATLAALATYLLRQWIYKRPMKSTAILPFGTFLAPFIWVGWLLEALLE